MTIPRRRNSSAGLLRTGVLLGIAAFVFMVYALPFYGLLVSLALPFVAHSARRHLWPETPSGRSIAWSVLAWLGLWLPALLSMFSPALAGPEEGGGFEVSTSWLLIPLCAPDNPTALTLPAVAAGVTCFAGLLAGAATRQGWPWVVAAWAAPWVHHLVFTQIPHEFIC